MTSMLLIARYGAVAGAAAGAVDMALSGVRVIEGIGHAVVVPACAGTTTEPLDAECYDSLLQSRGVMPFSFAYSAADSSIIGRTSSWSGCDPVGDHLPLVAVPLLELDRAAALVVERR